MQKFIAYNKLSKKKQKEINVQKRKTWGNIKPIIKIKPSAKLYNRNNRKQAPMNFNYPSVLVFYT
ncbi:MAG: hypothetical protein DBY32_09605 [Phascolarctobacterium sp.]|nr:MAG: hypothetical protein DBY32_09605 [Phascolarctobacterium sp.]